MWLSDYMCYTALMDDNIQLPIIHLTYQHHVAHFWEEMRIDRQAIKDKVTNPLNDGSFVEMKALGVQQHRTSTLEEVTSSHCHLTHFL